MITYATPTTYTAAYGPPAPADLDGLLRAATVVVARAVGQDPYAIAADAAIAAPLVDATCAQARAWVVSDVDPEAAVTANTASGGTGAAIASKSLDGGSVTYDRSASLWSAQQRQEARDALAPQAAAILTVAGLLWVPLPIWDEDVAPGSSVDEFGGPGGTYVLGRVMP